MLPCRAVLLLALLIGSPHWPVPGLHAEEPRHPSTDSAKLSVALDTILDSGITAKARWGLLVVDPKGKIVYQRNPDQLFAPASVTKVYSCAAAMIHLGADFRFTTPVFSRDEDLILVASGDLTMGGRNTDKATMAFADDDHIYSHAAKSTTGIPDTNPLAGLDDLAKQIKAAGITQIKGDVLVDTRLFETITGSGSGPKIVTPILINDNIVDLVVTPAESVGESAKVRLHPQTDFIEVEGTINTGEKKSPTRINVTKTGPRRYKVSGSIGIESKPQIRIAVIDEPAAFARALFIDRLKANGIEVDSPKEAKAELPGLEFFKENKPVAKHRSLPLSEALKVTMKVSHNPYASTLPLLLAVKNGKKTLVEGMKIQAGILEKLGVDVNGISLESGAGGGDGDKVSPRATVALLQGLQKRSDWDTFYATLPILGVDGTLATAVDEKSPARGKVFGKTGTYTDVNYLSGRGHLRAKSLAGVTTTAKGTKLTFCIFCNDIPLPPGVTAVDVGKVIGKAAEAIYQHGP
jgi:D-alanyl-D-alanine carboxypeptidase/D-alanyl-D-alanine-endopeptidase (penicillin-binding protein 4)